jgi:hypothetical protein
MVSEMEIENHVWDTLQAQEATAKDVEYIQRKLDDYIEIDLSGSYTESGRPISSISRPQPSARTMNQQRTSATSFGKTEYMFKKVARQLRKSS